MVLILCGKLLRKWASEFEWGMWRNIEWGIGIGVTAVGVLGIAAALYLVWKFRENTGNPKMTAFAGSEPEKAGKTAKSSEGAAADKSETDEIEKSRQMQFEARAAAEAEKEQLFLKKSEKVPNELLVLVGGFAFFRMASAAPAQLCQIPHCCRMGYCNRVCADRSSVFWNLWRFPSQCRHSCLSL
ncbi:MAG: hypothetical protein ACLVJU_09790 [Blautia sp.]